ncbi:hypothetical protein PG995_012216 [Apiospora arundinis]
MAPTFLTIPPEVRLEIYQQLIDSLLPESDEYFHHPSARSLIIRGTSPYVTYKRSEKFLGPWTVLRVCKLVQAELQPLLDGTERSSRMVYEFQGFHPKDMQAWAAAAGPERVARMQRWTMSAAIRCPDYHERHHPIRTWERVQELEQEEGQEDLSESEIEGDDDEDYISHLIGIEYHVRFHGNSVHVDLTRLDLHRTDGLLRMLAPFRDDLHENIVTVHQWFWWDYWGEHGPCANQVESRVNNILGDFLHSSMPPRVTTDFLCTLLHELSYDIRYTKSLRGRWKKFLRKVRFFDVE